MDVVTEHDWKMPDVPICDQQTFIIYAHLHTEITDPYSDPPPPHFIVHQQAMYHCATGFESVSGKFQDVDADGQPVADGFSLTPSITEDGKLTWTMAGDKTENQQLTGTKTSFELTLKTRGSDIFASCEKTYTVHVLLFSCEHVIHDPFLIRMRVGDRLTTQEIKHEFYSQKALGAATITNASLADGDGHLSGLSLIVPGNNALKITGAAKRPGVYLAWVNMTPDCGEYTDFQKQQLPGLCSFPIIVEIIDSEYADGLLMVRGGADIVSGKDIYRVTHMSATVADHANSAGLIDCELKGGEGLVYAGTNGDYSYQLRHDASTKTWILEGKDKNESEWTQYDSSAERVEGQTRPHTHGWAKVIIQAPPEFLVSRRQGSDGEWENCGFFHLIAPDVYEQQVVFTPQFSGMEMPEQRRFDQGLILSDSSEDFKGYEVRKQAPASTVTPYAPPQTEYYGEDIQREVAHYVNGAPHGLQGEFSDDKLVVCPGSRWVYWPGIRRLVPLNGTEKTEDEPPKLYIRYCRLYSDPVSGSQYYRRIGRGDSKYVAAGQAGAAWENDFYKSSLDGTLENFTGVIQLTGQTRDAAEIRMLLGCAEGCLGSTEHRDWDHQYEVINPPQAYFSEMQKDPEKKLSAWGKQQEIITDARQGGANMKAHGAAVIYCASGPATGPTAHDGAMAAAAGFSVKGEGYEDDRPSTSNHTTPMKFHFAATLHPGRLFLIKDDGKPPSFEYLYYYVYHKIWGTYNEVQNWNTAGEGHIVMTPEELLDKDTDELPRWAKEGEDFEKVPSEMGEEYAYWKYPENGDLPHEEQLRWYFDIVHWREIENGHASGLTSWKIYDGGDSTKDPSVDLAVKDPDGRLYAWVRNRYMNGKGRVPEVTKNPYWAYVRSVDYADIKDEIKYTISTEGYKEFPDLVIVPPAEDVKDEEETPAGSQP